MTLDFGRFDALTFDCYGTLIDWETGIVGGPAGRSSTRAASRPSADELLETFARHEAEAEAGPYLRYREVLGRSLRGVCAELGGRSRPTPRSRHSAARSATGPRSPIRPTRSPGSSDRFRLGVITNCDDDLFAASNRRLGVTFDWIVTAQQAGSYKPDPHNFELALERIDVPRERILHVAQSLYHDHVTARTFGLSTAWIDRRHDKPGFGATPPATATPDVVALDMASFADLALGAS